MTIQLKKHFFDHLGKWLVTLLSGFFLFFVLFFYEGFNIPQGLSFSGHSLLFRTSFFGLLTSFILFIHEFFLSGFISINDGKRKVAWRLWEVFIGANLTFLFYNYFWNWTELFWDAYFLLLAEYTSVMIFPILISQILSKRSAVSPPDINMLVFLSENGKHRLSIKPETFLYVKSEDNYVEIYYVSDGKVKCELQRNSLKTIETAYPASPYLLRCHRSYIVNPGRISQILTTNRQMQLDLGYQITIPVSLKYQESFSVIKPLAHSPHI